jgi:hypothetical protein
LESSVGPGLPKKPKLPDLKKANVSFDELEEVGKITRDPG